MIACSPARRVANGRALGKGRHLVPDARQETVNAVSLVPDDELGEDDGPLGVHRAVGDPVPAPANKRPSRTLHSCLLSGLHIRCG